MRARPMTKADLKFVQSWYDYTQAIEPLCGHVLVNRFNVPVFIGYLLPTPIGAAYLECFIASPVLKKEERRKYVKSMVQYLLGAAKAAGYKRVIGLPTYDSLTRVAKELGFHVQDKKADYCIREL